jgi:hypothetical protein
MSQMTPREGGVDKHPMSFRAREINLRARNRASLPAASGLPTKQRSQWKVTRPRVLSLATMDGHGKPIEPSVEGTLGTSSDNHAPLRSKNTFL